jgi:hypothetical protein
MIELRWAPTLQYRIAVAVDASGAFCPGTFGEWIDVPCAPQVTPLDERDAIRLWHENADAHKRESAFEWFAAGIIAAERAHGISMTTPKDAA